mgnify:CR=1 FL=1
MLSGLIYSLVHIRIFTVIPVKELADLELILGSIFSQHYDDWRLLLDMLLIGAGLFASLSSYFHDNLSDRNGSLRFSTGLIRFRSNELP